MSPTFIGLLILLGVGVMAGIAFAAQDFENKKRAKNLRLIQLKTAIRRAEHLFSSLPPLLMTTDVRALLVKYLEVRWTTVVELEPSEQNKQQQAAFQAAAATMPEAVSHPTGSMTVFPTQDDAARALGIVKELAQFITELQSKGEVKGDVADKLMREAKRSYARIEVDMDLMNAVETEHQQGPEVVIHHYRSCFSKLDRLNIDQSLDRQLYEIRTHLSQLAEKIDQQHEDKRKAEEAEKDSGKKFNF